MKTKTIYCPMGALVLGVLRETESGCIQGDFLGSPRVYKDWPEADARSELEVQQWHDARQHEPDDTPYDFCP